MLDLLDADHLKQAQGEWRFGSGFVPGEPNEGLASQLEGSPARLPDYDDSRWEVIQDLPKGRSKGFTFGWYRTKLVLPETVGGRSIEGARVLFETCIDDYGEGWIDGKGDRERGTVQGFNVPQRVLVTQVATSAETHTVALLAANGPLGAPGGTIFVRYAILAFEWPDTSS